LSRLITLGCSQTRYVWPTWADIVGRSFDAFENWGHSGIGNRAIYERTVEMLFTSKPTQEDLVIIQWTNPYRFDAHKVDPNLPARWAAAGNIMNWPKELAETIHCDFSYVYHTCNFIVGCKNLLENKNIKFIFLTMNALKPYVDSYPELSIYENELNSVPWLPPIYDWFIEENLPTKQFKKKDWHHLKTLKDEHPTPMAHYLYLEKFWPDNISVKLDKEWAQEAEKIVNDAEGYVELINNLKDKLKWYDSDTVMKGL